jgi:4-hydroxyphenylacetate 3-monooxygenase
MADPAIEKYMDKYYSVGKWIPEERGKLLYFARDLLNSSYAGHLTTFELFAQSPPFAQQMAVFNNFDAEKQRELVRKAADLQLKTAVPVGSV